jgi:hypothetical protein
MVKRSKRKFHKRVSGAILALAPILVVGGCGEEEKKVVENKAAPVVDNTPKVAPVTSVSELMTRHGIDQRISLAENDAPGTDAERIAILKFFHSMITADGPQFSTMLSSQDRMVFNEIQETGTFQEVVMDIGRVELQGGSSPDYQPAVVAVIRPQSSDDYAQLWTYQVGNDGSVPTFTSAPTPLSVIEKISMTNRVTRWYQLLDEELALAMALDEELEIPQVDARQEVNAAAGGGAPPSRGPAGPLTVPDRKPASPPKFVPGSS